MKKKNKIKVPHKRKILFVRLGFHYAGAKGRRGVHVTLHIYLYPSIMGRLCGYFFLTEKYDGQEATIETETETETETAGIQRQTHTETEMFIYFVRYVLQQFTNCGIYKNPHRVRSGGRACGVSVLSDDGM